MGRDRGLAVEKMMEIYFLFQLLLDLKCLCCMVVKLGKSTHVFTNKIVLLFHCGFVLEVDVHDHIFVLLNSPTT